MIISGIGGAKTQTGLRFEERTDLRQLFEEIPGYDLRKTDDNVGYEVWFNGELKAYCFKKYEFYRFLERPEYNINWKDHLSKRLLGDVDTPDCKILTGSRERPRPLRNLDLASSRIFTNIVRYIILSADIITLGIVTRHF